MNIIYYKAKDGIYLASANVTSWSGRSKLDAKTLKINGMELQPTFNKAWFFVPTQDVEFIEEYKPGGVINSRFILRDTSLQSDKIPLELTLEQAGVTEYWDDDWNGPFEHLQSLYTTTHDKAPDEWVKIEFTATCQGVLDIQDAHNYIDMKVRVYKEGQDPHNGSKEVDLSTVTKFYELEQALTPEFLLHKRPCYITSKQTFDIVRHHVKENIDPKQAVVTSDYDFCFTVKKKIAVKPYIHKWEEKKPNGRSYARPRIHQKTITHREVEIFEMTSKEKKYGNYTPIEGFKGDSLEDLINNVKAYLDELMFYINQPVKECEHCGGTGHIVDKSFKVNER